MTDRELMQQALDLLDDINQCSLPPTGIPLPAEIDHVMEALRARLAQPEQEPVAKMREMLEVQGRAGNWNYDAYMQGMYNGMEFMVALAEGRDPVFRDPPEKWLHTPPQREWQGLTDEEIEKLVYDIRSQTTGVVATAYVARAIEAKLKEKNT